MRKGKRSTRLLALLLAAVMCLTLLPGVAMAEGTTIAEWNYDAAPESGLPAKATGGSDSNATLAVSGANYTGFSSKSLCANAWTEDGYWLITVNTQGYEDLKFSAKMRSSNTGPANFQLQYRTASDASWSDVENGAVTITSTSLSQLYNVLSLPVAASDCGTLQLRCLMANTTSVNAGTVATGGASNINNIVIAGTAKGSGAETFEKVAKPTASTTSGTATLSPGDKVTLSCATEGAAVSYNTTSADAAVWTVYTEPIAVPADASDTFTIYAKATKEGMTDSDVATFTYTVETGGGEEETTGTTATLVTNASELAVGDQIVIVASGYDVALGTTQNGNNRAVAAVTKDAETSTVTFGEDVQVLTLKAGTKEDTFAFYTGSGYLYAASSSGNYLRTEETLSDNSSWTVAIETGIATVKAQGTNTRNLLRYNSGNKIFSCYASDQQDIGIYKLNAEPAMPTRMATEPKQLDKVYIYNPGNGMVLTGTTSGAKLAGTAGTVAEDQLTVTEGMLELVVSVDTETGYYSFITADGKYLTSGATGNGLSLAEKASDYSLWTLAEDGVGYVINNVNAKFNQNVQAMEYYNGFTTYGTKPGNNAYIMQFYKSGVAEALPGGAEEPNEPETITGTLTETLTHGDQVVIFYGNDNNLVMSGTADSSNKKLTGVAGTVEGSTLTTTTEAAIFTVYVDVDGNLSFVTADGKYLTSGATGSSLSLADQASDYSLWTLDTASGGSFIKNVNAKYGSNAQYIEYYKGFTTYGMNANSAAIYTYQFYKTGHVENLPREYKTDSSVVESIAAWGGGGPYDDTANATVVYGDKYVSGDQMDTGAQFTIVANGEAAKPFQTTPPSSTSGTNYYMGGANIGKATGDYAQFAVSTAGWGDMELSFRMRATGAAPGSFQLQYSVDGGKNFRNFSTGSYSYSFTQYTSGGSFPVTGEGEITDGIAKTSLAATYYITFVFDVPAGAENAENLLIRLAPGTDRADKKEGAIGGNIRIDSVVLSGSPIVDDSITGYVTVDPDGVEEDQAVGTALTMACATEGAAIQYRFVNTATGAGEWNTYSADSKPVLSELPATLEVKAKADGKAESVTRVFTYAAGTVSAVKMSPNGGGVYFADATLDVTLTCATEGATIYYNMGEKDGEGNDAYTEYTAPITLTKDEGPWTIKAYAVKAGFNDSSVTERTFTQMATDKYSIYFGQIHSHTNISDGAGSITDAYEHASGVYNLDFLAVTDHSNSFDGDSPTLNTDATETSPEWKTAKKAALAATTDKFVGIYGFEMTWSNGLGHMNTYNTAGWQSRTQSNYTTYSTALQNYYAELKTAGGSISQFNHPGTTFGDFTDFSYYDAEIDELITMIEVGNGEGAIGSSGYFPSYEYYTRALDKGWHVAPSNNQDNHKGLWGDANTARTVVLATDLSENAIYDAMRNYRVYATEDNDLSIYYTLDGNIMGTILDKSDVGEEVTLTVDLSDATDSSIGKVEVIVNGGLSLASTTVSSSAETVTFTVPSTYNYYYIKVTEDDGDIAVTAPVWIGKVEAVGISGLSAESELTVAGEAQTFTLDMYNNEKKALENIQLTVNVYEGAELDGNTPIATFQITTDPITSVPKLDTASCTFQYTFAQDGVYTVQAIATGTLNGVEKTFTQKLTLKVMPAEIVNKIVVDGSHYNDYVTGYYGGNMGNMTAIAAENGVQVVIAREFTADTLKDCSLLVISAPARKSGTANAGAYTASVFEDDFINLVADYVEKGGSVAVCGLADYQDKNAVNGAEGHAAAQINKLLAAIGSSMSINDDEVYDAEKNGGQFYRLYPENFNTDSAWTYGIADGQTYSQYSGCSVNPGSGTWLVKGFDTTYSVDSDKDGVGATDEKETDDTYNYNIVTPKGQVVFLACEETQYGGTIFAAGGVFLSDFEVKAELDNIWDLPYANRTIYENILGDLCATENVTPIKDIRAADKGRVFVAEGYVTSGTANANTSFFDAIYIQDETGGITVFPYANEGLEIGTKVRVIGYTDEYQGDKEIQIISLRVLNEDPKVYAPKELSTKDAMDYETYGGQLVSTTGTVSDIVLSDGVVSQFKLTDDTGVAATVFIDGYITNADGKNEIASWIKEGQTVSAVGLLYKHPEGSSDVSVPVLRVRNCDEIKKISDPMPVTPSKPTGSTATTPSVSTLPFYDVKKGDWFYDDVKYVYDNGIMNGVGANEFAPHLSLTRGMIVTILYRLENEPSVRFDGVFGDVKDGLWYSAPVEWAAKNGIITGYTTGGFGPTDSITREQLATILYRYAKYKGYDVSVGENTNILSFTDAFEVSEYAIPAMQWAVGVGLINGADGKLMPKASASRAQVAAIIHRFLEK